MASIKKPGNNHTITTVLRSSWRSEDVYSGEIRGGFLEEEDLELKSKECVGGNQAKRGRDRQKE